MPETTRTAPDADWRAAHRKELVEKQRHISQKLAQLREYRALVRKWRPLMRQYRDWFAQLETSASAVKWFSVQSLIRMLSITTQLNQAVAEFGQIGAPKATGSGASSTAGGSGASAVATAPGGAASSSRQPLTEQQLVSVNAELLTAKAGPLASMAPWELVWFVDPETSEAVRKGDYGVAVTNALCSPFTSLTAVGFAEGIADESIKLIQEHPEEFEAIEKGWKDTKDALDDITEALDGVDWNKMRELEAGLEDVLSQYESAYNGARGADETGARQIRQAALTPPTTR